MKLFVSSDVDGNRALVAFFVAEHDGIRIFIILAGLDLFLHIAVAVIHFKTDPVFP